MVLTLVYDYLWGNVLRNLYFGGPSFHGYGFWSNRNEMDICADLTNVPADHWSKNEVECMQLLQRHFRAFEIGVNTVLYITIGMTSVVMGICHVLVIRPFSKIIKK